MDPETKKLKAETDEHLNEVVVTLGSIKVGVLSGLYVKDNECEYFLSGIHGIYTDSCGAGFISLKGKISDDEHDILREVILLKCDFYEKKNR